MPTVGACHEVSLLSSMVVKRLALAKGLPLLYKCRVSGLLLHWQKGLGSSLHTCSDAFACLTTCCPGNVHLILAYTPRLSFTGSLGQVGVLLWDTASSTETTHESDLCEYLVLMRYPQGCCGLCTDPPQMAQHNFFISYILISCCCAKCTHKPVISPTPRPPHQAIREILMQRIQRGLDEHSVHMHVSLI